MLIGDTVTYKGRRHVVVGFTPMTVTPPEVELLDPKTEVRFWVEWPPPVEQTERAALKIAPRKDTEGSGGTAGPLDRAGPRRESARKLRRNRATHDEGPTPL